MANNMEPVTKDPITSEAEDAEVFADMKYPLLSFEKQIFIDAFENDALVIMAKYVFQDLFKQQCSWVHDLCSIMFFFSEELITIT